MTQKSILITGAAAGIGQACAVYFAERGWCVGAFDVNETGLLHLKEAYPKAKICIGVMDVCSAQQWCSVLDTFYRFSSQRLDVLLNNAGVLFSGEFNAHHLESYQRLIDVNVTAVVNACHSAFPYLKATENSRVINLASASAIYGQADLAVYSASKFAVRGLSEALDLEWQEHGIRVMALWPGFVQTQMIAGMQAESLAKLGAHLSAQDIAKKVWQISHYQGLRKVHWAVGWQTQLFIRAAKFTPDWLNRWINYRLSRGK